MALAWPLVLIIDAMIAAVTLSILGVTVECRRAWTRRRGMSHRVHSLGHS
jgi:hypothetical protein